MSRIQPILEVADNPALALGRALPVWVGTRDPALGHAILGWSERALEQFSTPPASRREVFHRDWLAIGAHDTSAVATGWLAQTLTRRLPKPNLWEAAERFLPLRERINVLMQRCPDPRIARAAVELLRRGEYGAWEQPTIEQVYQPLIDLLIAAGDPTTAPLIEKIAARPRARQTSTRQWQAEALPEVARTLHDIAVEPLTEPDRKTLQRWIPTLTPEQSQPETITALVTQVYRNPNDDGIRAVLADALLTSQDPRGTLMARQLEGVGDDDKELKRLIRTHGATWLGEDVATVLRVTEWRLGFPHSAELRQNHVASPEVWETAYRAPQLGTLQELRQGSGNRRHYQEFVTSAASSGLKRVEVPTQAFAIALAKTEGKSLEALEFASPPPPKVLQALAQGTSCLPVDTFKFRTGFDVTKLTRALLRTGWGDRLRVLEVESLLLTNRFTLARATGHPFLPMLPHLMRLPGLARITFSVNPWFRLDVERLREGWGMAIDATVPLDTFKIPDGNHIYTLNPAKDGQELIPAVPDYPRLMFLPLPSQITSVSMGDDPLRDVLSDHWGVPISYR